MCFSLPGRRYFKTQSKLIHFIKSVFQKHQHWGPYREEDTLKLNQN